MSNAPGLIQSFHQLHELCTTCTPILDEKIYLRDQLLREVKNFTDSSSRYWAEPGLKIEYIDSVHTHRCHTIISNINIK